MYIINVIYFKTENYGFENINKIVIIYDEKDYDIKYVKKIIAKKGLKYCFRKDKVFYSFNEN